MKVLEKLGEAAHEAASVEQAKRDSGREEQEGRVAVLRAALELVKPALPAIVTKTKLFGNEEQHLAHIGVRGQRDPATTVRWQLYVAASGALIEDCREWKDGAWVLTSVRVVEVETAARLYTPEDVAARLLHHLTKAIEGNALRRTDEALRRAVRYRALAALLESIGGEP